MTKMISELEGLSSSCKPLAIKGDVEVGTDLRNHKEVTDPPLPCEADGAQIDLLHH